MAFKADIKRSVGMAGHAVQSKDGQYRYKVTRSWGPGPRLVVIVHRAGNGDHELDDRTIRTACARAKSWGLDGVELVALFAARTVTAADLNALTDPVGPKNDQTIKDLLLLARRESWPVLVAWGDKADRRRAGSVLGSVLVMRLRVFHLGITAGLMPKALESAPPSARPMIFDPRLVRRVG